MLTTLLIISLIVAGSLHLLMLALLNRGIWKLSKKTTPSPSPDLPALSVLVAARDEASNLAKNLPSILTQAYPTFELIVILNQTDDESVEVLEEFQRQHSRLKVLNVKEIPEDWPAKKWALQKGAEEAQYEQLVLIDADCWAEENWLKEIGGKAANGSEWILGLGLYEAAPGWLGKWIAFETHYTAFQYMGAAGMGIPYMAVGRNLSYPRSILLAQKGLEQTRDSLSGDDDLLVNAFARADKTTGMLNEGSRTWSRPAQNWQQWWAQKTRHVSASNHYSLKTKALLALLHLSHVTFYAFCVIGIAGGVSIALVGYSLLGMLILRGLALFGSPLAASERGLQWYFLGLEISQILYNLSVVPVGLLRRPIWKTRS